MWQGDQWNTKLFNILDHFNDSGNEEQITAEEKDDNANNEECEELINYIHKNTDSIQSTWKAKVTTLKHLSCGEFTKIAEKETLIKMNSSEYGDWISYFDIVNFILFLQTAEKKHCVKSVQIWSYFWSVFSCIRIEYRKIRARTDSVFGHFSRGEEYTINPSSYGYKSLFS